MPRLGVPQETPSAPRKTRSGDPWLRQDGCGILHLDGPGGGRGRGSHLALNGPGGVAVYRCLGPLGIKVSCRSISHMVLVSLGWPPLRGSGRRPLPTP